MKFTNFLVTLFLAILSMMSVRLAGGSQAEAPQLIVERHEGAPVMTALSAMYAPAEDKDHWISLVCSGMTAGGCVFFQTSLADAVWESQADHAASSAGYIADDVIVINDRKQVWKASLTIFHDAGEVTSEVFLLVERGRDGFWYLDRVLYGPGI